MRETGYNYLFCSMEDQLIQREEKRTLESSFCGLRVAPDQINRWGREEEQHRRRQKERFDDSH